MIAIDESDGSPADVTTISIATPGVTPAAANPYTIEGSPAGFVINTAGDLTAQLDYEMLPPDQQTNGITITIRANGDVTGQNGTIELTITVNNIDDEAPVIDPASIPADITVAGGTTTLSETVIIHSKRSRRLITAFKYKGGSLPLAP